MLELDLIDYMESYLMENNQGLILEECMDKNEGCLHHMAKS